MTFSTDSQASLSSPWFHIFKKTAMKMIIHVYNTTNKIKGAERVFCRISKKSIYVCIFHSDTNKKGKQPKTWQKKSLHVNAALFLIRWLPLVHRWCLGSDPQTTGSSTVRPGAGLLLVLTWSPPVLHLKTDNTQTEAMVLWMMSHNWYLLCLFW